MMTLIHHVRFRGAYTVAVVFLLLLVSVAMQASYAAPAPVYDASATSVRELNERIKRLERRLSSQSIVELMTRMDRLQNEMQKILGEMELQRHQLDTLKKRQKDLYVDIDKRLTDLQKKSGPSGALGAAPPASGFQPQPVTPLNSNNGAQSALSNGTQLQSVPVTPVNQASSQLARTAYEQAFELLKKGRYELAAASFKAYLESYPNAQFANNAQYWLGEANYVQGNYKAALIEFKKVLSNYPNSTKKPDAILKMGYAYNELGEKDLASKSFKSVLSQYPDSSAARLAKKRLQDLQKSR